MLQIDRKFLRNSRKTTGGGNRLGQRPGPDVNLVGGNAEMFIGAATSGPDYPGGMRFIDQEEESEFLFDFENLRQMANVTIHGKNAVRDHQGAVGRGPVLQLLPQRRGVVMAKALQLHSGEPAGIRKAAMAERIHDHAVRRTEQRPKHGDIRQVA